MNTLLKMFLTPTVIKSILRHLATILGAYLVQKGVVTDSGWTDVCGAVIALIGFGHSLHDKWPAILADIEAKVAAMNKTTLLLVLAVPALLLTGCKNEQIIQNSHTQGVDAGLTIPVPFGSGTYFLAASLKAGDIKANSIIQPALTNGPVSTAPVTIVQNSYSTTGVNGSAGTNNTAGIVNTTHDQNVINTAPANVGSTNGSVSITH